VVCSCHRVWAVCVSSCHGTGDIAGRSVPRVAWASILYGLLYAGFGVQSPYLPILLDNRHLGPETIALALAAGTAMRLMAAQAVAQLADRLDAPKVLLALCTTAAALVGLGYLPAQGAWLLIAVGVLHLAALAPLPPLSDTLALGAAAPAGSGGAVIHYGWLRGCGSAAFALGLVLSEPGETDQLDDLRVGDRRHTCRARAHLHARSS
jgi:predicted MFS family arabinose efflux permease